MDSYIISVTRKVPTNEWLASVNKNGKWYEPGTAYTDTAEDAVDTAIATIERYRKFGDKAELSNAAQTLKYVSKYRPDFLISETKRAIPVADYARYAQHPSEISEELRGSGSGPMDAYRSPDPHELSEADKAKIRYNANGGMMG